MTIAVYTDPLFLEHDTGQHPECPQRLSAIEAALRRAPELEGRLEWRQGSPAADAAILRCHSSDHLRQVDATAGMYGSFDADTMYSPESARAARLAAGTVMDAAEALLTGDGAVEGDGTVMSAFCLVRPPGHHATRDRPMGFCLFNSVAIAARHLQSLGCEKILIVDWDVHHGNGTQDIFYDDPTVLYYSLHQHPLYPGTGLAGETGSGAGRGFTLNRPLPPAFPVERYHELFAADIARLSREFTPDFVCVSCGFDAHRGDPLGGQLLEDRDFARMTEVLAASAPEGRLLSVLEGGYNLQVLGPAAVAHLTALLPAG